MRKALAVSLAFSLAGAPILAAAPRTMAAPAAALQDEADSEELSPEQLDNLLAPIALYPDPLLAQVLLAATFVDQVDEAARYVRARGQWGVDDEPWDVSVKAVAHYPVVLDYLADHLNWTTVVGQAYVGQSTDVMISIQRLRRMARSEGNLETTSEQEVVLDDDYIRIVPARPTLIYVPQYDPAIVYHYRPRSGLAIVFGVGLAIGAWLNDDCDWRGHRVYYHGWNGAGWIVRSRPHVRITTVYVSPRYSHVSVDRRVLGRSLNYWALDRYTSIHRNVTFDDVRPGRDRRGDGRAIASRPRPGNAIIERNINTTDSRLDRYRGRDESARPTPGVAATPRSRPAPSASAPATGARSETTARPGTSARPGPHAFGSAENAFDPSVASRRGRSSREAAKAPPEARRAPAKARGPERAVPRGAHERSKERPPKKR